MKNELKHIYTAAQCCDISDCQIAIQQATELCRRYPESTAAKQRLASLYNRKEKLEAKSSNLHPVFANILKPFMP